MHPARQILLFSALSVLVAALFLVSLGVGPVRLLPGDVLVALLDSASDETNRIIIREIRLPRTILALSIGAAPLP